MNIGLEAQKAIDIISRNYGGHVYLDDGQCAGWFDISPRGGRFTLSVKASPGSICDIARMVNAGNRTGVRVVLTNTATKPNIFGKYDTWQSEAFTSGPFLIRPVKVSRPIGWGTTIGNALRNAFLPPPVYTRAGTALFGTDEPQPRLSNQYRVR